jgi:enoyl-[acyl-carrier-protein] reductase (NADH)
MKENMVERHPMKNYLKPEEVAEMADFLISEKAKSISGQVFEMDYGIVSSFKNKNITQNQMIINKQSTKNRTI